MHKLAMILGMYPGRTQKVVALFDLTETLLTATLKITKILYPLIGVANLGSRKVLFVHVLAEFLSQVYHCFMPNLPTGLPHEIILKVT